ncbi:hypothetical protein IR010_16210 [Flavobacterium sp. MR2016-29]|uniref:DUF7683 domain-containing protein n=1 Tax=Flavobacterium sp. MR2016-29 TaxID=2783795 RepID=UPI00188D96A6|nr:hypothetical protein [Flavobacterium sp. MR2016-29]MBF4494094.1 hypothetical protein [Flavobacterium sp. MR2016-29]
MKKQLLIELYSIENDLFLDEIDISRYDLKKINEICPPYDEFDYEYCNGYEIEEEEEFIKLKEFIEELKTIDFFKYSCSIITRQI